MVDFVAEMEAIPGVARSFGPADNAGFYAKWLRTDPLYDSFFLCSLDLDPFHETYSDELVPTMAYLAWYGRHLVVNPGKPVNRSNVLVAMWADLMAPCIGANQIMAQDQAREALKKAVTALLRPEVITTVSDATLATYTAEVGGRVEGEWTRTAEGIAPAYTPENAIRVLKHLARRAGAAFSIGGVSMIVHVYLATLKRGTMSDTFIDKIIEGMTTDLQITNLRIDALACRSFFALFGEKINERTIALVTEHWSGLLPVPALRLRLTVQQAAGSGLTALSVTGRSIRLYADFNWSRISQLYPDEWQNFSAAVALVGNNVWYGFKKDLGIVSSTKYKNLTYVAKELLIKVNGEATLRNYAGWTRRAKYQAVVDQLIAEYEGNKTANILEGRAMPELIVDNNVARLRDMIINGGNVYA